MAFTGPSPAMAARSAAMGTSVGVEAKARPVVALVVTSMNDTELFRVPFVDAPGVMLSV